MPHVTTKNILKQRIEFHVNYDGKFSAKDRDGNTFAYNCDTLKQAERLARLELKKSQVRISVPFTTKDFKPAIARGRHARNRSQILVWIDDGTPKGRNDTIYSSWSGHYALKPDISKEDLEQLHTLLEKQQRAQAVLSKIQEKIQEWNKNRMFNLGQAVDEAIKEAQPKPEEES